MNHEEEFERLISDARSWRMTGWDFSRFRGRWIEEEPPWDFGKLVRDEFPGSNNLLDIGTGGGEFLSSLVPLPRFTLATEGWKPNVQVARKKLHSIGVQVIETFCEDNTASHQNGALPFQSGSFDLIIDRHESFVAGEVLRALRKDGIFLTQQVGTRNLIEINEFLGAPLPKGDWDLTECKRQAENAGLRVEYTRDVELKSSFKDVGAVLGYILSAPWQVPGFSIDGYMTGLRKLHDLIEKDGFFDATATRFVLKAVND